MAKTPVRSQHHGLLLVHKPANMTSHDVVSRVRRIAQTKEVGHSGTLDPLAEGLMVVLIGEGTKLSSIVTEGDKAYVVSIKLGYETDTLDSTGAILREFNGELPRPEQTQELGLSLSGDFLLDIPLYSAKKIDGKKLYEYAREGVEVEIPQKLMKFWNVEYFGYNTETQEYKFSLECSKGSFIRSWVKLLGDKLGCGATMTGLLRTKSHHFNVEQSVRLEKLLELREKEELSLSEYLTDLKFAVKGVKTISVSGHDEVLLNNGQISHDLRSRLIVDFDPDQDEYVFIRSKGFDRLLAIIGLEPEVGFKIKRVFKY